jgi:uncharacterized protein (UPF0548 family)
MQAIQKFQREQAALKITYAPGSDVIEPPPGFIADSSHVALGHGEVVFRRAKEGLEGWQHFRLGWVEALPEGMPLEVGQVVAILARLPLFWCLNACRIIAVIDEDSSTKRFGFTYATLPDHVESGQERFLIEWNQGSGEVCYAIKAVSRPRHWLARLAYPWTRRVQKRFARDSCLATKRFVSNE